MKRLFLLYLTITAFIATTVFGGTNSTVTRGYTFSTNDLITAAKLHTLVDSADVTGLKLGAFDSSIRPITISGTAPTSPSESDFWYDSTSLKLKQYRSSAWVILFNSLSDAAITVNSVEPGTKVEGDIWCDTQNNVMKMYDGSGWDTVLFINEAATISGAMTFSGDNTFSGTNHFSGSVRCDTFPVMTISDDPTEDTQLATKGYVDGLTGVSQNVQVDTAVGTDDISTTSTSYVDMTDMTFTDTFAAGNISVLFTAPIYTEGDSYVQLLVDSTVKMIWYQSLGTSDNIVMAGVLNWAGNVSAGSHTVKVQWKKTQNTAYQYGTKGYRFMKITRGLN